MGESPVFWPEHIGRWWHSYDTGRLCLIQVDCFVIDTGRLLVDVSGGQMMGRQEVEIWA